MNRVIIAAVAATALLSSNVFAGPSAKFAATWDTGVDLYVEAVDTEFGGPPQFDVKRGLTLATIKVPQDKELLVGVSAEIGLTTDTSVKGKNGGAAKAIAGGLASVVIFAVPTDFDLSKARKAKPGRVILSKRIQTLSATLGGVIESCNYGIGPGTIDVSTDCTVHDEEIALMLDTMAAHHFNFVLPNMDQGEYYIVAFFTTRVGAEVIDETVLTDGTSSAVAESQAWVGKTMVTVQQVRAAEGGVVPFDIVEW